MYTQSGVLGSFWWARW